VTLQRVVAPLLVFIFGMIPPFVGVIDFDCVLC